ncbi:hypothetical protein H2248_002241 [Termitomyces sp. 'cryptogamus']|nr:hypothetical protein H2248_002241 [Termitomyces sp. 'cryptogamus']
MSNRKARGSSSRCVIQITLGSSGIRHSPNGPFLSRLQAECDSFLLIMNVRKINHAGWRLLIESVTWKPITCAALLFLSPFSFLWHVDIRRECGFRGPFMTQCHDMADAGPRTVGSKVPHIRVLPCISVDHSALLRNGLAFSFVQRFCNLQSVSSVQSSESLSRSL